VIPARDRTTNSSFAGIIDPGYKEACIVTSGASTGFGSIIPFTSSRLVLFTGVVF